MANTSIARTEDLIPVGSRVSWGAILAGAMVALAIHFLLSVLGTAIGLSISSKVENDGLGIGAAVYAVIVSVIALFLGGWITSQCAVGENKVEATVYGIILWGVVFAILLWLMVSGVRMGFNEVIGFASTAPSSDSLAQIKEENLRAAGLNLTDDQVRQFRAKNIPGEMKQLAQDPKVIQAAWWTFGGILLSMLAAVGGALVGSGPNMILRRITVSTTGSGSVRTHPIT